MGPEDEGRVRDKSSDPKLTGQRQVTLSRQEMQTSPSHLQALPLSRDREGGRRVSQQIIRRA